MLADKRNPIEEWSIPRMCIWVLLTAMGMELRKATLFGWRGSTGREDTPAILLRFIVHNNAGRGKKRLNPGDLQLWLLTLVLIVTLVLGGSCNSHTSQGKQDIYFLTTSPMSLEDLRGRFQQQHPTIRVHVTYRQQIEDDWPKHFDAALLYTSPRQGDLLLDLKSFVEADEGFQADDFFPGALSTGFLDSRLVSIPLDLRFDMLAYSPHHLTETGVTPPQVDWKWDDMLTMALAASKGGVDEKRRPVFARKWEGKRLLLNRLLEQVTPYEEVGGHYIPALNRPEVIQAMAEVQALQGTISGLEEDIPTDQALSLVTAGQVLFTEVSAISLGDLARLQARYPQLAFTAFPQPDPYSDGNMRGGEVLAISRGTAHPEVVWEWVSFLSREITPSPGNLSARRSVADGAGVWAMVDLATRQAIESIMRGQEKIGIQHGMTPLRIILESLAYALNLSETGKTTTIERALEIAQEEAMAHIKEWYDHQGQDLPEFSVMPPETASLEAAGKKTLHVFVLDNNASAYQVAAQAFAQEHPDWTVRIMPDFRQADAVSLVINSQDALMLVSAHLQLLPLDNVNELRADLSPQDFLPQALEAISWQGHLLGIPTAIRPVVLYYDRDIFARLGIPEPMPDWTVADVLKAAKAVHQADPLRPAFVAQSGGDVAFVLEQLNVPLFTSEFVPGPRFTAPDVLQAIDHLRQLRGDRRVMGFAENPVMVIPTTFLPPVPSSAQPSLRAVALRARPKVAWPVQVYVTGVPKGSRHVQVAWQWAAFLAQHPEVYTQALPALRARLSSPEIRQRLPPTYYEAYRTALERSPRVGQSEREVLTRLSRYWFDQALRTVGPETDLTQVLTPAQARAAAFLVCTGGKAEDWEHVAACLRQVDPTHPLARTK